MPTPKKADPKPGNHRTGRSRRSSSRGTHRGTASIENDLEALQRIELVSKLYHHPASVIQRAVNKMLAEQGQPGVDIRTIYRDRARALEMWRVEGIVPNMDDQMAKVLRAEADVWQSIEATPRGPARAGLYITYFRSIEIQERMAGRWNRPVVEGQSGFGQIPEGPSPFDLYEQGLLPEEAYLGYLATMAKASGQALGQLPPGGPVIEGRAQPVRDYSGQDPPEHDSGVTPRPYQMRKGQVVVDPTADNEVDVFGPGDLD